ncbi:PAS domain S-box-containing protein/diguanylate cyclase (GGDEF) domain-containing protein [Granulicella rosea]|uniref:PAS domain S-box-containing protein/diguanylate cyclase (GGDEF) domain-containing protein n=1 Tax=Granulicella rosea TaxID=474952 RepID=A0A239M6N0_9BACT|nr:EAL domain-containing protein [Granulicella rosea]SNT37724.1 PAS domain S-box-containing protein/diguanylate cyclase (GGDEF) domain-containing protein [Granulicella rosea]
MQKIRSLVPRSLSAAPGLGFVVSPNAILDPGSQADLEAVTSLARSFFRTERCFLTLTREFAKRLLGSQWRRAQIPAWANEEGIEEELCLDTRADAATPFFFKQAGSSRPEFFARTALIGASGARLGSICIADDTAKEDFTSREKEALRNFAGLTVQIIEQRLGAYERMRAADEALRTANRVRMLLEATTDCVFVLGADWVFTFINKSAIEMIAQGRDLIGSNFWDSFPTVLGSEVEEHYRRAIRDSVAVSFEAFYPGAAALFEVNIQPSGDGLAVFFRNITEQRAIRMELQRIEARYRLATLAAVDGIWDWDHATGQTYFSARWQEIVGLPPVEIVADISHWLDRLHPNDLLSARDIYNALNPQITSEFTREYRIRHENGDWRWILSRGTVVRDPSGRSLRTVGSNRDITHERSRDPLSSLHNRGSLLEELERRIEDTAGDGKTFALLLFDIDGFQQVNDRFGEGHGDLVLIEIAARLESTVKDVRHSLVARVSGDEFAVVLGGVTEVEDAITYAQCLHTMLAEIPCDKELLSISISIGIAMGDEGHEDPGKLLENAGIAMHQAKNMGADATLVFGAQMRRERLKRVQLEADLRHAIARQQLVLHYQSKVCLDTGKVMGYEALVRWMHPVRGMIPPMEFIPYAEECGLIIAIGEWTLHEALRQLMEWRTSGFVTPDVTIAVNLSTRQFNDVALADKVANALSLQQAPASCLTLEVTESAMIGDLAHAKNVLDGLRAIGISLDLDDFGTGYSSLSYLHRLPFQALKIDRSFTRHLEQSHESRAIARSILQLGKSLNLAVIAEGIENEAQRVWLVRLGCRLGQGFLYSKPLSAAALKIAGLDDVRSA